MSLMLPKSIDNLMLYIFITVHALECVALLTEHKDFKFNRKNPQADMANCWCLTCRAHSRIKSNSA